MGASIFVEQGEWLRDQYHCIRCGSIPRQRALITRIGELYDDLSQLVIHESSPDGVSSDFLTRKCGFYSASQYFPDVEPGTIHHGFQCENLENLTFPSESFNVFITQDVMEHVLDPEAAFSEIARVLKPGGHHIFTVPLYKGKLTKVRARKCSEGIEYLESPDYHSNPVDSHGSLVVTEWGDDLGLFIERSSSVTTEITSYSERLYGLAGEFLDVLVSTKPLDQTDRNS